MLILAEAQRIRLPRTANPASAAMRAAPSSGVKWRTSGRETAMALMSKSPCPIDRDSYREHPPARQQSKCMALEFHRDFEARTGEPVEVAPGVRRVTAPNPGPFTFQGTNTFLIGGRELAVLDPGPADPAH